MLRAFCFMLWRMGFSLPSFAKINWTLRVLGKREDGYHELYTVFQTVSLKDTLRFDVAGELTLTCDNPAVPVDESNLVLQAARALQKRFNCGAGATVDLQKHIPFPVALVVVPLMQLSPLLGCGSFGDCTHLMRIYTR